MTPSASVNHTFDSNVTDVPNPFFAAVGQRASSPFAASLLLVILNSHAFNEATCGPTVPWNGVFEKLIVTSTSSPTVRRTNDTTRDSSELRTHSNVPRRSAWLPRLRAIISL